MWAHHLPPARRNALLACCFAALLAACSSTPIAPPDSTPAQPPQSDVAADKGSEVALFAIGLIDTGYRFGGKNPEAGLDCSGMVTYIYSHATNIRLTGSAADLARKGRQIDRSRLRAGDLVFFNTEHRPFSHVGIYIGDGRFVHAPSTNGRVRISRLDNPYFAPRFEMARTYLD